MGILDRVLELDSDAATRRRMETKCDESFSAACGDRRGAQRLFCNNGQNQTYGLKLYLELTICSN
jgi:hypothetical protein